MSRSNAREARAAAARRVGNRPSASSIPTSLSSTLRERTRCARESERRAGQWGAFASIRPRYRRIKWIKMVHRVPSNDAGDHGHAGDSRGEAAGRGADETRPARRRPARLVLVLVLVLAAAERWDPGRPAGEARGFDRAVRYPVRGGVVLRQVPPRARRRARRRGALLQRRRMGPVVQGRRGGLRAAVRALAEGGGRRALPMRPKGEPMREARGERAGGSLGDGVRPGEAAMAPRHRRGVAGRGNRALRYPG